MNKTYQKILLIGAIIGVGFGLAQSNTIPQEPALSDVQNALSYFIKAGAMVQQEDVTSTSLMVLSGDNSSKESIAMVQKYSNALSMLEQGLQIGNGKSPVRWQNLTTPEALDQETRRYQGMNSVHNLLLLRMLQREKAGKFLDAIDDAKRALEFARIQRGSWGSVDLWFRSITSQKASMDAIARMSQSHKQNASDLRVMTNVLEAPFPIVDAQESLRSQLKVAMGVLQIVSQSPLEAERTSWLYLGSLQNVFVPWTTIQATFKTAQANGGKFDLKQTQKDILQDAQTSLGLLNTCDYPADLFLQQWQKQTSNMAKSNSIGTIIRAVLNLQILSMVNRDCNARAQRNMTTLKYALWAFEVDKKVLPQSLNELLPLYLRAVPICPYRASALQYDPKERFLVCKTSDGLLGEGFGIVGF